MSYRQGLLEVTPEVRSVPLGVKRKRGRPKKVGHCLSRSPQGTEPVTSGPDMLDSEEPASAELSFADSVVPASAVSTEPTLLSSAEPSVENSPEFPPSKKRKVARQWGEPRPEGLRRSKRSKK